MNSTAKSINGVNRFPDPENILAIICGKRARRALASGERVSGSGYEMCAMISPGGFSHGVHLTTLRPRCQCGKAHFHAASSSAKPRWPRSEERRVGKEG